MVPIPTLWAPILLSGVFVFVASSIIHMVLTYHRSNVAKLPKEDEVMEALRKFQIPPGDYMVPCGTGPASMKDPAFLAKMNQGPVAVMTVMKPGPYDMGRNLAQWFAYCLAVGVLAAYLTGRALGPGAQYLAVFRFAGTVAFIGYAMAQAQQSIWYQRRWSSTFKYMFDGLVYGLLTGGTFGWLWPN